MAITIIGAGSFGTALAQAFSEKHNISLYSIEKEVIDDINKNHQNSKYLPDIKLNKKIKAVDNYDCLKESEIILLCVPSSVMKIVCENLKPHYDNQLIISASKGIDNKGRVMSQVAKEILGNKVIALSGPSIAKEVAAGKPTKLFIGGRKEYIAHVKEQMTTSKIIIDTTIDIIGIQLLAFYKNLIAILVGICNGLELGKNFTASLISKAYSNFYYKQDSTIHRHTFVHAAGIGDLFVTCLSKHSRNQGFGYLLGKGNSIEKAKEKIGQTIEGLENINSIIKNRNDIIDDKLRLLFEHILKKETKIKDIEKLLLDYIKV